MGPKAALLSLLALAASLQGSHGGPTARLIDGVDLVSGDKPACAEKGLIGYFMNFNGIIFQEPVCHGVYVMNPVSKKKYILGGSCLKTTVTTKPFKMVGLRGKKIFGGCTAEGGKTTPKENFYRATAKDDSVTKAYLESSADCEEASGYAKISNYKTPSAAVIDYTSCFVLSFATKNASTENSKKPVTRELLKQRKAQKVEVRFDPSDALCAAQAEGASATPKKGCFVRTDTGANCWRGDNGAPVFCRLTEDTVNKVVADEASAVLVGFNYVRNRGGECNRNEYGFYVEMLDATTDYAPVTPAAPGASG